MVAFFACIVLIPTIPIVFPFVLAIVWFYAMFDTLQKATVLNIYISAGCASEDVRTERPMEQILSKLDHTVVSTDALLGKSFSPIWMGVISILIGIAMFIRILLPQLWAYLLQVHIGSILLTAALIGFGIRLIYTALRKGK